MSFWSRLFPSGTNPIHASITQLEEALLMTIQNIRRAQAELDSRLVMLETAIVKFESWQKEAATRPKRYLEQDPTYQALPDALRKQIDWHRLGYEEGK